MGARVLTPKSEKVGHDLHLIHHSDIHTNHTGSTAIAKTGEPSSQLSTERAFVGSASFSRTVWLPRPVDGANIKAKLLDGVLTLTIPKAEDRASVKIPVD